MRYLTKIAGYGASFILAVGLVLSPVAVDSSYHVLPLEIESEPLVFDSAHPEKTRFGALEWRGGVALTSEDPKFGGLSGLVVSPDGQHLIGVSDVGNWITADLQYLNERLIGLENVKLSRLLGAPGERLNGKVERDSEGVAVATNGDILIAFERYHRVARYDFSSQGFKARADYIDLPEEIENFSANKGFESVGQFGVDTQLFGQILVIAERHLDEFGNHSGWLLSDNGATRLSFQRSGEFDITDLEVLSDGRVIILERRYSIFFGPAMRLRMITLQELLSGEVIHGQILMLAKSDLGIDNMEGLSVHISPAGETILTLLSDDNFRDSQRTLIMQFALQWAQVETE